MDAANAVKTMCNQQYPYWSLAHESAAMAETGNN
jgi:hypothetical protein